MNRFINCANNKIKKAVDLLRSRFGGMYMDFILKMVIIAVLGAIMAIVLTPIIQNTINNSKISVDEQFNNLSFVKTYFNI